MPVSRLQFQPRAFAIASLVIAAISLSLVTIPQWFSKQARLDVLRANVGHIAQMAASVVDGDLHRELLDPKNYTPELYERALQPLVKLHSASPEVVYMYTMVDRGGQTFFVLDTANSKSLKTTRKLVPSAYMEAFKLRPEYESDWLLQLAAGKTWVTPTFQQDDYGNFLTGHSPIYDSNGKYVGFVGVDFNLQYYLRQEGRFNTIVFWSVAGALLMSLVLGYLVARYQFALHRQVQRHYQSSVRDQLTELFNRRGVLEAVADALRRRKADSHATLLVDIDQFKVINDTHGHAAGDEVIARLASSIKHCIRAGDICARLGGDEFMIFAPACDIAGAQEVAERLLETVRADSLTHPVKFTVSIGISVETHASASFDAMYRLADTALYRAKSDGKNRFAVCVNAAKVRGDATDDRVV